MRMATGMGRTGHVVVALSAWANRGCGAALQLYGIRSVLGLLGNDQFAAFALITGLLNWYALCDLGFGFGAQNRVSERRLRGEPYQVEVQCALRVGLVMFMFVAGALYLFGDALGAQYLQRAQVPADQLARAFFLGGLLMAASGTCAIIYKVWYGELRGELANLLSAAAALLSIAGLWRLSSVDVPDKLEVALLIYLGPAAAVPLIATLWRIVRTPAHSPRPCLASLRTLAGPAGKFWTFALLSALVLNVDYVVMSQVLDAQAITEYTVLTKILGFGLTLYVAFMMALWPVMTGLAANGEWYLIRRYLRRHLVAGMLGIGVATIGFMEFRRELGALLSFDGSVIPTSVIAFAGIYFLIRVWTDTFSITLQSMGDMGPLIRWVPAQALLSVACQFSLAAEFGIGGIFGGLAVSFLLTVSWALPRAVSKRMAIPASGNT
jgi:O-antigen/teichoic acid export membrane protein